MALAAGESLMTTDSSGRKLEIVAQNPQGCWSFTRIPVIFWRAPPVAALHAPKNNITNSFLFKRFYNPEGLREGRPLPIAGNANQIMKFQELQKSVSKTAFVEVFS
jgi:hypothetical protein